MPEDELEDLDLGPDDDEEVEASVEAQSEEAEAASGEPGAQASVVVSEEPLLPPEEPEPKATSAEQQQSRALLAQGTEALAQAEASDSFDDYSKALKTLRDALSFWKGNEAAREAVIRAELLAAECAFAMGDYGLAERQLVHRGTEHRRLNQRIDAARREAGNRKLRRQLLIGGGVVLILGVIAGVVLTLTQKPKEGGKTLATNWEGPGGAPRSKGKGRTKRRRPRPRPKPAPDPRVAEVRRLNNKAVKLYNARKYKEAIAAADEALDKDPNSHAAYNTRSNSRGQLGDIDGAYEDIEMVIQLQPKWSGGYNNRGNLKMRKGDLEGAIEDFDKAISLDKKIGMLYCNRARASQMLGQLDKAIEFYTKSIEKDKKYKLAWLRRGLVRLDQGDAKEALADLTKATDAEPKNVEAWAFRAVAAAALGNREAYDRAVEAAKGLGANAAALEAQVKQQAGLVRLRARGKTLKDKALTKVEDHLARAQYYLAWRDYAKAADDFKAVLKGHPELGAQVYPALMQIAEAQKAWPAKLEALRGWVKAAPENPTAQNAYAWELLTSKDETLRDPKAALPAAEKADKLTQHKNAAILDTLALALFKNGKAKEAVTTQKKAIKLLPANVSPAHRKEYDDHLKEFEAGAKE